MKKLFIILSIFLYSCAFASGISVNGIGQKRMSVYDPVNDRQLVLESNNAMPVNIQDQHSHTIGTLMSQVQGAPMTLDSNTVVDSYTLTMATGHSFIAGDEVLIAEDSKSFHALVLSVSTDILTLNAPIDQIYTTGSIVFEVISNMAVNGSVTVQEFSVQLGSAATISLDITGIRFVISDGAAMDDGTFGGISALTRGIVLRIIHTDGTHNLWTAKTNGKMGLVMDNKVYTDKAPAGENSVHFTWEISEDLGVTIRLDAGDKISLLIQDDNTGNTNFKAWVYGHYVTD